MGFAQLSWLFAVAITLHNLEEGIWLPAWSRTAGRWRQRTSAGVFRFAVIVLTLLAYIVAYIATSSGKNSIGAYLITGYALAMLLNVLLPHVLATLSLRRYAPGTATALLLNLPITVLLIRAALQEGYVHMAQFVWTGPLVALALLLSIPALFAVGAGLCALVKRT